MNNNEKAWESYVSNPRFITRDEIVNILTDSIDSVKSDDLKRRIRKLTSSNSDIKIEDADIADFFDISRKQILDLIHHYNLNDIYNTRYISIVFKDMIQEIFSRKREGKYRAKKFDHLWEIYQSTLASRVVYFIDKINPHVGSERMIFSDKKETPKEILNKFDSFLSLSPDFLIVTQNGMVDISESLNKDSDLKGKIAVARDAAGDLVDIFSRGNRQHDRMVLYGERYLKLLVSIEGHGSPLAWYATAQSIEAYFSSYDADSNSNQSEFPPFDTEQRTSVNAVIFASGLLARSFPQIADAQDDFRKYVGKEVAKRNAVHRLTQHSLGELNKSHNLLTPAAAKLVEDVLDLNAPMASDVSERLDATKVNVLRGYLSALGRAVADATHRQMQFFKENIRTKGVYDISKEVLKALALSGFGPAILFIEHISNELLALANESIDLFGGFVALLRLLNIIP